MNTETLANLIAQKLQVLELLHRLAQAQAGLIDAGDMTRLLPVLGAKQKLLGQLQQLEQALNPFRDEDPAARRWPSPEARDRCRENAARCESLLAEILQIEKQGESEMVRRRDVAAERLQGVHVASEARAAYTDFAPASAARLDMSSDQ